MKLGAHICNSKQCEFVVWAPFLEQLCLKILTPVEETFQLTKNDQGYWRCVVENIIQESRYVYDTPQFKNKPDPVSYYQPLGVHGPSQVVDHSLYQWSDQNWKNLNLGEMIIYELHVGTFTEEGSFDGVISRLDDLKSLGINVIELMPVAQFPGERNWGYDGVDLFAVQNSYGGPEGLKKLVDQCHQHQIAVVLDVVYNHLGPEGNYLGLYGPYFTNRYQTPWGPAINFDDAYNDHVRRFFIENALYWFEHFHIDALRLDAVHAICDLSTKPFLRELKDKVEAWSKMHGRKVYLIAESDLNDVKIVQNKEKCGFGIDAQWSDDFHHSIHSLLTKEKDGYYQDFGSIRQIGKALEESFVYSWDYSTYRKRFHGSSAKEIPPSRFVVSIQNHDQIGNRLKSERLSQLVSFEALKVAAGILLLSPYIPLIFMGEEYGEECPFNYFVSHSEKDLIEAVRKGRKEEFSSFQWRGVPLDPQDENVFMNSKLKWTFQQDKKQGALWSYYQELIRFRKGSSIFKNFERKNFDIKTLENKNIIYFREWNPSSEILVIVNLDQKNQEVNMQTKREGKWQKIIDSMDLKWAGSGAVLKNVFETNDEITAGPMNFAAYQLKG